MAKFPVATMQPGDVFVLAVNGWMNAPTGFSVVDGDQAADLKAMEFAPREVRSKAVELLSADTFDRAALETLRAEQVAIDRGSGGKVRHRDRHMVQPLEHDAL